MGKFSNGLEFHGAFSTKRKAEARRAARPGSFIIKKFTSKSASSLRYIVATRDSATDFDFGFSAAPKKRARRGRRK